MLVRAANVSDLADINALQQQDGFNTWSTQQLSDSLQAGDSYVLMLDNQLIAFALFQSIVDEAELLNIVVQQKHQGKGFAQQLLQHSLTVLAQQALTSCFLEVAASNTAAIRLYQKCQFTQVGLRKNYYLLASGKDDALIMKVDFNVANNNA